MHTIALVVTQLVLVLIICFMEDNHYSLSILSLVCLLQTSEAVTYEYVQELKSRLEHAFQKANKFCNKEALRSKKRFDKTAKCSKLLPGDLVLVRRKGFTMKHKIADKWETEHYEIVSQRSDGLPVYCKVLLPVSSLVVHKIYCATLENVAKVYP